MVRRCCALLLLLVPALAFAQPRPPAVALQNGALTATLPLEVLNDSAVRKQLGSGLTTTFLIIAREGKALSAARLEVRYDLWDEVWLVRRIEFDRRGDVQRVTSREALEAWWRGPVRLIARAPRSRLQIELTVLPFSAAEEEDARQWIAKSGGVGTANSGSLVDALIGTTISAKPIVSYRWDVEVPAR
ncbi:MAG TPA: hypothetical protein VFN10_05430 [Thermoanaerobaculia bacterium]|nr:hypothetical protein [Thermoanaerobaculia bacterium]